MNTNIQLIFPHSASKNYDKVLKSAKTFKDFKLATSQLDSNIIHVAPEELCLRFRQFENLYKIVNSWKGTELRLNGEIIEINVLLTMRRVFKCAQERMEAIQPEKYCEGSVDSNWGCKRLFAIGCSVPEYIYQMKRQDAFWFQFGHFTSDDHKQWIIDKDRLFNALTQDAKQRHVDHCPFFDPQRFHEKIDKYPKTIELSESSCWVIQYSEKYDANTVQKYPIGIMPKTLKEHRVPAIIGSLSVEVPSSLDEPITRERTIPASNKKTRYIPPVSFADVGGVEEIIDIIREVIELPFKNPNLIKHMGITPHKGVLLCGTPGCGKTLIAKAIANEISAHFISIGGSELFSKYIGESEENLRNVFTEARDLAPSIIFFDEIDSIGQKRSGEESVRYQSVFGDVPSSVKI